MRGPIEVRMEDTIKKSKIERYMKITSEALEQVKGNIIKGKEPEAREIIDMVDNYLSDAKHFMEEEDYVDSFAALNYAHGWLDCGVRTGVFDVNDDRLFTIK